MSATVNEILRDDSIGRAVDLNQYSNGLVRRMVGLLNSVDADIFAQLSEAVERLTPESFTVARLETLLASVRELNAKAYARLGDALPAELKGLTGTEIGFQRHLFTTAIPPQITAAVGVARVNVDQVYAAMMAHPMQGRLLSSWVGGLEQQRATRIASEVAMGYIENESVQKIVQRVRGTRSKGYSDGVIEIDRRNAEAVVRTAVSHTAGFARDRFHDANKDLIKAIEWVSTLDGRTSSPCRLRDRLRYQPVTHEPVGHKVPWLAGPGQLHWNCRSTSVPVTKSWKELGGADLPEFNPSTRASMDGQVAADLKYGDWLKKQSAARQDQVLGKERADMFRKGGGIEQFYNDKGQYLTLAQLRARSGPEAPRAAFDESTAAGKWHSRSFDKAPTWLKPLIEREQAVEVTYKGGDGAYAVRGKLVNMGSEKLTRDGASVQSYDLADRREVWRHEFGHILDARLAKGLYRSAEGEFPPAQHNDAVALIQAAGRTRASKATTAFNAAREADYESVRALLVDAAKESREAVLEGIANRAGLDYKRFRSVVADSTLVEGDGIGALVRIGKMMKAVERGDGEEFIRQAMYKAKEDGEEWKLSGRSFKKDGSFSSLSDLFGSTTKNKVSSYNSGLPGHSDSYYKQGAWFAGTEAFANLTALAGHPNSYWWELVKRFAPNMAREYEAIVRGAMNG